MQKFFPYGNIFQGLQIRQLDSAYDMSLCFAVNICKDHKLSIESYILKWNLDTLFYVNRLEVLNIQQTSTDDSYTYLHIDLFCALMEKIFLRSGWHYEEKNENYMFIKLFFTSLDKYKSLMSLNFKWHLKQTHVAVTSIYFSF